MSLFRRFTCGKASLRAGLLGIAITSLLTFSPSPALAATGTITGTVTAASGGAPIQNLTVIVFTSSHSFVGSACTSSTGTYSAAGLATGTYVVEFYAGGGPCGAPQNYVNQYYNNKASFQTADPVSVTEGSTTSGINAAMAAGGQISGTVTAASGGAPIQGIAVTVLDSSQNFVGSACTSSAGTYSVLGLVAGSYKVEFEAASGSCGVPKDYATQYYNNKASFQTADPVSVTAGSTTGGIDAAMAAGGHISGTVTAASGRAGPERRGHRVRLQPDRRGLDMYLQHRDLQHHRARNRQLRRPVRRQERILRAAAELRDPVLQRQGFVSDSGPGECDRWDDDECDRCGDGDRRPDHGNGNRWVEWLAAAEHRRDPL